LGSLIKPGAIMLLATPRSVASSQLWMILERVGQCILLVLSLISFGCDLQGLWIIYWTSQMSAGMKIISMLVPLSTSSNLSSVATVFNVVELWVFTGQEAKTFRDLVNLYFDFGGIRKAQGTIFAVYAYFLLATYGFTFWFLVFLAVPGVVLYFWVFIPVTIVMLLISRLISCKVASLVYRLADSGKALRADIVKEIRAHMEKGVFGEPSGFDKFFIFPIMVPLVSFFLPLEVRFFSFYGYIDSVWLTYMERHTVSYLNHLREMSSLSYYASFLNLFI